MFGSAWVCNFLVQILIKITFRQIMLKQSIFFFNEWGIGWKKLKCLEVVATVYLINTIIIIYIVCVHVCVHASVFRLEGKRVFRTKCFSKIELFGYMVWVYGLDIWITVATSIYF